MSAKRARPSILVVHGPNLNLLGAREPEIYGRTSLAEIDARLTALGREIGFEISSFQSNNEGEIVTVIQQARGRHAGLLINPAAYTHTSVAIRDAILALEVPVVEIHLSNIHKREEFRRRSMLADVVAGQVLGFGPESYTLGLRALAGLLQAS